MLFFVTIPIWLGVIIFIINWLVQCAKREQLARSSKKCPMCAETVKIEARVCHHCSHDFDVLVLTLDQRVSQPLQPQLLLPKRPSLGNS